jgi:serine protease SohB
MFWRRRRSVVPVVRLSGVISQSGSLGRRGLSLESVEPQLKKAFSVKRAKAVAIIINSPGGSPVQSSLIGQRIRDLANRADVPVLAFARMWRRVVAIGWRHQPMRFMPIRHR